MKIEQIDICPVSIEYKTPYTISVGTIKVGKHVIIRVYTNEGIVGLGEAPVVRPERTGETQENIVQTLKHYFAPLLIGKDPFDIENIMRVLDTVQLGGYGFPYCKAAIDNALYDIMGKAAGIPVYKLLGGAVRKQFAVSRSLSAGSPDEVAKDAEAKAKMGYKMLTLKGTRDWNEDLKVLQAVRKVLGEDFPLEIDPNQAWPSVIAIRAINAMAPYGIESVEQPCPWWDIEGMAMVAEKVEPLIIADESVMSIVDALNIVKRKAADKICIKIARGGCFMAKR